MWLHVNINTIYFKEMLKCVYAIACKLQHWIFKKILNRVNAITYEFILTLYNLKEVLNYIYVIIYKFQNWNIEGKT